MKLPEFKDMTVDERLKAMEALWETFIEEDIEIESPGWHGDVLTARKEKVEKGEATFISLDKLKQYNVAKD